MKYHCANGTFSDSIKSDPQCRETDRISTFHKVRHLMDLKAVARSRSCELSSVSSSDGVKSMRVMALVCTCWHSNGGS